ncbi:MAG: flippase [Gemmatimonadaceae bacterium]
MDREGTRATVRASIRARAATIGGLLLGKDESASVRQRVLAGIAGLLSLRVAFGGIAFVVTILLARLLGASGLGAYSYALAWVSLLGAPAILGMDQLLVREVAGYQHRREWGLLKGVVQSATRIVLAVSLPLVVGSAVVAWTLRNATEPETVPTLLVSLVLIPLIALTRVRQATLQGLHRVVVGSVPERLVLPGILAVLLAVAWISRTALSAPVAMGLNVGASAVAFIVGAWTLHRHFPAEAKAAPPVYRTGAWLRAGLPIFLVTGVSVVFNQADLLILGLLRGSSTVGPYGVADKTSDLLTIVLAAQASAFASTAASLAAQKDTATLQRMATRLARLTLLATLPLAIVFIGFGGPFLSFFYGSAFASARVALVFLSIGQLVNAGTGLNSMLLVMTGETGQAVKVVGTSAAVNVGLNLLLVPRWGMEGAAAANMISLIVWNVLATIALQRSTGIHSTALGGLLPRAQKP